MRWSPGTTPNRVGVVALLVLELAVELEPLPPPHADKKREKEIQKYEYLLNLIFISRPIFDSFNDSKYLKEFCKCILMPPRMCQQQGRSVATALSLAAVNLEGLCISYKSCRTHENTNSKSFL